MRYPWLDELEKNGTISAEACEEIYDDCSMIIKHANPTPPPIVQKMDSIINSVAMMLGMAGIMGGVGSVIGGMKSRKEIETTLKGITETRNSVLSDPDLMNNNGKAEARFNEVATIAPSVAQNKNFMVPFIKSKLNAGLDEHDIERLALLQANYTTMPQQLKMNKTIEKSSILTKTSAEKLGESMADCHFIVKEALNQKGEQLLGGVGKALLRIMALSSIPVLGGVGVGAFKEVIGRKRREEMERAHEASFLKAMKLSDPDTEPLHANKDKAEAAFKTLAHFAPNVAIEPQAAKAFMNKLVSYDMGINIGDVKDLSEIEKNIGQVRRDDPFLSGFASGTKDLGLSKVVGDSIGSISKPLMGDVSDSLSKAMGFKPKTRNS